MGSGRASGCGNVGESAICEPTTILAVATLATGAFTAYQQNQAGKAQQQAFEQQAQIDRAGAADAMAAGDRETERMLWRTRQALGQQRAAIGASGLDPTFGTPLEILGETAAFGQMEMADARMNAARNAWGYEASAITNQNRGANARWEGRQQAIGTVLGSMAQAGGMYYGNRAPKASSATIGPVQREAIPMPRAAYRF